MESHLSPEAIITCEHAGNSIPVEYRYLFVKAAETLNSHRGWDPGSLYAAELISKQLQAPLYSFPVTRLLIEVNRSLGHRRLFSEFSKKLTQSDKNRLIENYYKPYRNEIEQAIRNRIDSGIPVIHIGVHSFTPVYQGRERDCDIGLLFDPAYTHEKQLCSRWKRSLKVQFPELSACLNKPYKGADDGLTTHLRSIFNSEHYYGLELEINQKHLNDQGYFNPEFSSKIAESLKHLTISPV